MRRHLPSVLAQRRDPRIVPESGGSDVAGVLHDVGDPQRRERDPAPSGEQLRHGLAGRLRQRVVRFGEEGVLLVDGGVPRLLPIERQPGHLLQRSPHHALHAQPHGGEMHHGIGAVQRLACVADVREIGGQRGLVAGGDMAISTSTALSPAVPQVASDGSLCLAGAARYGDARHAGAPGVSRLPACCAMTRRGCAWSAAGGGR